jgi:hypothetical protein
MCQDALGIFGVNGGELALCQRNNNGTFAVHSGDSFLSATPGGVSAPPRFFLAQYT